MALRLPSLPALRLFEAAGRHRSFKLAAEELHLTAGAVSHGVASLERWLGILLFERRTNGVLLTRAGDEYLSFISEALAMSAVGTRRLPNGRDPRRISISLAPTFAARWLLPRLPDFRSRHPDIVLTMDTSHRQVGFPLDNVDLAVRMARVPWPGLPSQCLFAEQLVPVCSSDFVSRCGGGNSVDLSSTTLLHVTSVTEDWAAWFESTGFGEVPNKEEFCFDTIHMAFDAAAAGLGVALGRRPLADDDLKAGKLVTAGPVVDATTGYWLIQGATAVERSEIKVFVEWLTTQCADE